ncbi:MAG: chorismate-binding protein, partial [Flavobacteriaceae bacterium]
VAPQHINNNRPTKVADAQNKSYYMELVAAAKSAINQSNLEKVVVSRQHIQPFTESVAASYLKLTHAYPNAMVYYWSHPHT